MPGYRRWRNPPEPQHDKIAFNSPLGSTPHGADDRDLDEENYSHHALGLPFWYDKDMSFQGKGRNRFGAPAPVQITGHGMDAHAPTHGLDLRDPEAGKFDPFGVPFPPVEVGPYVDEDRGKVALGTNVENQAAQFTRKLGDALAYTGTYKLQPSFLASGPSPKSRWWQRFTYRREFMQEAQSFPEGGEHTRIEPGARYSTSKGNMQIPNRSRLSTRTIPGAWGLGTEEYGE